MSGVNFDFKTEGVGDVLKAFTSIERSAEKLNRSVAETTKAQKKAYADAANAVKKAELEGSAASEKSAKQKIAAYNKAAKASRSAIERETDFQIKQYEKQAAANKKMLDKKAADTKATMSRIGSFAVAGAAGLALAAGAFVASSMKTLLGRDAMARKISVQNRGYGEAGVDPQKLLQKSSDISSKYGTINGDDAMAGIGALASNVGLEKSLAWSDSVATAAQAAGTSMEEMAGIVGSMSKKMNITDLETMQEAMAALIQTSKKGGVDFQSLSDDFGKLLVASEGAMNLSGNSVEVIKTITGLTNLGMAGSGKAGEATGATEAFLNGMKDPAIRGKLSQSGIDVAGKDPKTVIADIIKKTGGDMDKITNFVGKDAAKLFTAPAKEYGDALKNGEDAVKKLNVSLEKVFNATSNFSETKRDANDIGVSAEAQWNKSIEKIQKSLLPMVPAFLKLTPAVTGFADFISDFTSFYTDLFGFGKKTEAEQAAERDKQKKAEIQRKMDERAASPEYQALVDDGKSDPVMADLQNQMNNVGMTSSMMAINASKTKMTKQEFIKASREYANANGIDISKYGDDDNSWNVAYNEMSRNSSDELQDEYESSILENFKGSTFFDFLQQNLGNTHAPINTGPGSNPLLTNAQIFRNSAAGMDPTTDKSVMDSLIRAAEIFEDAARKQEQAATKQEQAANNLSNSTSDVNKPLGQ